MNKQMKILVSDKLSASGMAIIEKDFIVDVRTGLDEKGLTKIIHEYDALIVRSRTQVTWPIIKAAKKLKIIGRAGVGVDNIDIEAATKKGILVVNSPSGNTVAAAEHTFAMLLALTRNIPFAHNSLQHKEWKRSEFTGVEVKGKTLGVVGLGKIGRQVVGYAKGMGMHVIGYDPLINDDYAGQLGIELKSMDEVLKDSDYLTFHIPKTKETSHMINQNKFEIMKKGVYIINCARGGIIVEKDLRDAIESGRVRGAAIDVFEKEPIDPENVLIGVNNIITTPHIGAATKEAQENVAIDIAEQVKDVLMGREARSPVNIPSLRRDLLEPVKDFMILSEKMGRFIASLTPDKPIEQVEIQYGGDVSKHDTSPLTLSIVKGLLSHVDQDRVNFVNAEIVARERGIKIREVKVTEVGDYKNLIKVNVGTPSDTYEVSGTSFEDIGDMIVSVNQLKVNVVPEGNILVVPNDDRPGIIGKIGTLLGEHRINIASMQVGRKKKGGNAVMLVNVDQIVKSGLISKLETIPEVRGHIHLVRL